jgi:hypothetical protein
MIVGKNPELKASMASGLSQLMLMTPINGGFHKWGYPQIDG